jgi:hypothetical protein
LREHAFRSALPLPSLQSGAWGKPRGARAKVALKARRDPDVSHQQTH